MLKLERDTDFIADPEDAVEAGFLRFGNSIVVPRGERLTVDTNLFKVSIGCGLAFRIRDGRYLDVEHGPYADGSTLIPDANGEINVGGFHAKHFDS